MRWGLFGVAFVVTFAYVLIHLQITARNGAALRAGKVESDPDAAMDFSVQLPAPLLKLAMMAVSAGGALIFIADLLRPVGYLSSLSLRRIFCIGRSSLWNRHRILCVPAPLLRTLAEQPDLIGGDRAAGSPGLLRVLRITAVQR